jgi:hypothetical protein
VIKPKPFSSLNHFTVPVWRLDMVYLQEHNFSVVRAAQANWAHRAIIVELSGRRALSMRSLSIHCKYAGLITVFCEYFQGFSWS